ncbi:RecX family transcriptional regulator [Thermoactinomyces sp. AMNI-1]|uniref:Regulatory protein RecX n=1 Tax=Thermoactinomyces mirandus TaxID=2756294 RepID=A0A7W1XUW7_9BACL|nr:RecX family transcriptional regulator [Thermoactinomyces mirandus]
MKERKITQIEKPSSRTKRYNVYVDGECLLSVHEDVLVKYRLHKGMEIDEKEIHALLEAEEYNKAKQVALRYLSYSPRTVQELKSYLNRKGYDGGNTERVIHELEKLGFLNDLEYAKAWVEERKRHKGYGKKRLRQELLKKGIALLIVDGILADMDDDEQRRLAISIAERRYSRICGEPWPKIERRLGNYLVRQGYSMSIVYEVLHLFRIRYEEEKGNE